MSKTFPQESSEAFLNLKSLHYAEQKKYHQRVYRVLWKALRKKDMVYLASKKRNFLALSHLFWI